MQLQPLMGSDLDTTYVDERSGHFKTAVWGHEKQWMVHYAKLIDRSLAVYGGMSNYIKCL